MSDKTPSYYGTRVPENISEDFEDDYEEQTRRVALANPVAAPFVESTYRSVPEASMGKEQVATFSGKATGKEDPKIEVIPAPVYNSGWQLSDAPTLPEFYPLERTAIFVPHCPATEVSLRISNVLRQLSIEAVYDDVKAKVKCITAENVDFRVFLYRGRGQYSHGIIVEVQRRFGFSTSFHSITKAILDAAQGNHFVMPARGDVLPLPSDSAVTVVSDSEDDGESTSLAFVEKMLRHPGGDAHNLALQTLSSLTNAKKMGRTTARKVSRALLAPNCFVGNKIVEDVVSLKNQPDEFGTRLMAMTVLANAIHETPGDVSMNLFEIIRPVLVQDLHDASLNPQIAYLAARSLDPLLPRDDNPAELREAFNVAGAVGRERHSALDHQTEKCLRKLDKL